MTPFIHRPKARHTQRDHAQAFAVVLREEFAVQFSFYDAVSGEPITLGNLADDLPVKHAAATLPSVGEVRRLVEAGQPALRVVGPGRYELVLVLYQGGRPAFLAIGVYGGLGQGDHDEREPINLHHWLRSFAERLRLSDQMLCQHIAADQQSAQTRVAWEGMLALDALMRKLRIHREPTRNQQRVLETAHALVGAQAIVYVPADPQQPVVIQGEALLASTDCRHLAGLLAKMPGYCGSGPLFCSHAESEAWAVTFPKVATVLALPVCDQELPGWVIALNKGCKEDGGAAHGAAYGPPVPFRKTDAVLLTPFVGLLRMQHSAGTRFQDLKDLMVGLARALTAAIDAKDAYTFGHSERVGRIAVELGRALDLDGDAITDLYLAGLLHDVGKIGVPDAILGKAGKLTDEEFEVVKQHVRIGHTILADLRPIQHLLPGVLYHHERYDGRGYPEGLAGEGIPRIARILAVADAFDAMSTSRPYRSAMTFKDVEEQLRQGSGAQWDAQVIDAYLRCRQKVQAIRQRGVGESLRQALDGALRAQEPSTRVF